MRDIVPISGSQSALTPAEQTARNVSELEREFAQRFPQLAPIAAPPPEPLPPLESFDRRPRQWPWYALQVAVAVGVFAFSHSAMSGSELGHAPAVAGIVAAFVATALVHLAIRFGSLVRARFERLISHYKKPDGSLQRKV